MNPRLVALGGILVDVVLYVPHLPVAGGDVLASDALVTTGGVFNVLAAARRQGLAAAYLGAHGTGRFGDQARADLAAEGIGVGAPPRTDGDTGFCVGLVDGAAERTYATYEGVEGRLDDASLAAARLGPGDAVHLSGYDLAYDHGALVAAWFAGLPTGHRTFVDPGPVVLDVDRDRLHAVLARADWVSLNHVEATALTGRPGAEDALRAWPATLPLPRAGIVVRDGAAGCWLLETARPGEVRTVPVPLAGVVAVDTAGAGDCHLGTFAAALARGEEPYAAARWANAAAALSVQRAGPATGPTHAEVASALAGAAS